VRFIKIKKFCELTGYTDKAIYSKIHEGVWRQNQEYKKGPDNVILVDLEGYERWVRGEPPRGARP
jgi:hypothetical protein